MSQPTVVTISQPRYLPACNYLHRMALSDVFIFLDTVQYTPRDWENRNRIKTAHGSQWLSIPVQHVSHSQRIHETRIAEDGWRRRHWRAIEHAYARAPYFDDHAPFFQEAFSRPWKRLSDINAHLIRHFCQSLGIQCTIRWASELCCEGSGEGLLLNLCRAVGGDAYLSGPLGREYLRSSTWSDAGVHLVYHDYIHPEYPQLHGAFVPWMSAIDLLLNCGPASREHLGTGNRSRETLLEAA